MKKLLFIIAMNLTLFSFAQKPTIGIKAGLAISGLDLKYSDDVNQPPYSIPSSQKGMVVGVFGNFHFGEKICFRPGAELASRRAGANEDFGFTYLDIPLNILYQVKQANGKFLIGGGPLLGIFLKNYGYYGYSYGTKPVEIGLNAMVGYEIPIGFSLNLNYMQGLNNVNDNNAYFSKINNHYMGISIGYLF